MMTIIYSVILFALLIFPHELGHFLAAKAAGVRVNEFAFGMGPALFKKQGKETLYAVRLVPIGGYCAMDNGEDGTEDRRAFGNKSFSAKMGVLIAGSAMNVFIAVLVMSIVMGVTGSATTAIGKVQAESPAHMAGLKSGDVLISADGKEIEEWNDLAEAVNFSQGKITVEVEREGQIMTFDVVPEQTEEGRYVIGVTSELSHNVFTAAANGAKATWNITAQMFESLKNMVTGNVPATDIAGPVGMVTMVSQTSQYGLSYFGFLITLISMNLAIINLLPLPALDGGRILILIIRKITGKAISDETEGRIHTVGMILLFGLLIFATWNDITRLLT